MKTLMNTDVVLMGFFAFSLHTYTVHMLAGPDLKTNKTSSIWSPMILFVDINIDV